MGSNAPSSIRAAGAAQSLAGWSFTTSKPAEKEASRQQRMLPSIAVLITASPQNVTMARLSWRSARMRLESGGSNFCTSVNASGGTSGKRPRAASTSPIKLARLAPGRVDVAQSPTLAGCPVCDRVGSLAGSLTRRGTESPRLQCRARVRGPHGAASRDVRPTRHQRVLSHPDRIATSAHGI